MGFRTPLNRSKAFGEHEIRFKRMTRNLHPPAILLNTIHTSLNYNSPTFDLREGLANALHCQLNFVRRAHVDQ